MKGLMGYKVGMTKVYDEGGVGTPVSVVRLDQMFIAAVKTSEKNGYDAVQIGSGKKKNPNKAFLLNFKKRNMEAPSVLKEFSFSEGISSFQEGMLVNGTLLDGIKYVDVSGVSKGKGFQGGMKRFSFHGGRASHGSKHHRRIGSIGMNSFPARVWKGRKMPGRMGGENVTVQNLELIKNDIEAGVLLIKGAIPGRNGGLVFVRESKKLGVLK